MVLLHLIFVIIGGIFLAMTLDLSQIAKDGSQVGPASVVLPALLVEILAFYLTAQFFLRYSITRKVKDYVLHVSCARGFFGYVMLWTGVAIGVMILCTIAVNMLPIKASSMNHAVS